MTTNNSILYTERLSSRRTSVLFATLMLLCTGLAYWRLSVHPHDWLVTFLQLFALFFLFYTFNYRTLIIQLTAAALTLKFGVFRWQVPLENIAEIHLDHIAGLNYYGGAGIHFMTVDGRYRASFNFLEYPRVVVAFKKPVGPVRDLSFSTNRPDELLRLIDPRIIHSSSETEETK